MKNSNFKLPFFIHNLKTVKKVKAGLEKHLTILVYVMVNCLNESVNNNQQCFCQLNSEINGSLSP